MSIHAKTIGSQAKDIRKILDKPILYDVISCEDGTKIKDGITAKSAADFAGVSENFVIMTSIKPARNKYGHLVTMSGYYFTRHKEDPVEYDGPKDTGVKPGRPMIFRIDPAKLNECVTNLGYETAAQFCNRHKINYETLMAHVTRGLTVRPSTSQFAIKLCRTLDVHIMQIYYVRFA